MKGQRLKELRERRGLTQSQLAGRIGISQSTIARYESDDRMPDALAMLHLSEFFQVSSEYLLGISDSTARATTLPQGWEKVINDAMTNGFTPDEVARALYLLRGYQEGKGRG